MRQRISSADAICLPQRQQSSDQLYALRLRTDSHPLKLCKLGRSFCLVIRT